jgi:hypothetical protein
LDFNLKRSSTCLILNWWLEVLIMLKTSFDEKLANAKLNPWQKNKMSWDSCRLVGNKPERRNNGGVRHIYNHVLRFNFQMMNLTETTWFEHFNFTKHFVFCYPICTLEYRFSTGVTLSDCRANKLSVILIRQWIITRWAPKYSPCCQLLIKIVWRYR